MDELITFRIQRHCGHDAVHMRVMLHLATPGVKHADATTAPTLGFGRNDIAQRSGAFGEQQRVERFGMCQAYASQLRWHGEGDQEIGHRQQFGFLLRGPLLLVERPTLGTTAVVAAVVGEVRLVAVAAMIEPPSQFRRAARQHAAHGPVVGRNEVRTMGAGVARPMITQQVGESQCHGSSREMLEVQADARGCSAARAWASLTSVRCRYTRTGLSELWPRKADT